MLYAFIVAAVVIFVAEQGDKTQILAFALATKYKAWQVFLGIFFVNLGVLFLFTLVGRVVGSFVPSFWIWVTSGVAFIVFGVSSLRSNVEEAGDEDGRFGAYGPVIKTAGLFFLAEIGDQAELITMAIAANPAGPLSALGTLGGGLGATLAGLGIVAVASSSTSTFIGVWFGAVVGIMLADGLGVAVGRVLGRTLPEQLLRRLSGSLFVVAGTVVLALALLSRVAR